MKLKTSPHSSQAGTVLYVTLIITAVIGVSLASFLKVVGNQHRSIMRSQIWNEAIPIAEAGIEEAMAQINSNFTPASMLNNGWTYNGSTFNMSRYLFGNEYKVSITPANPPTITSVGLAKLPSSGNQYVSRTIQVTTKTSSLFSKAMLARNTIELNGNNITTDSFDSQDSNYSTGGQYDPAKRKANGDVATNSGIVNSLDVGNANVYGKVATGPGGSVALGPTGAVGDLAWHAAGSSGIQAGHSSDDMNVDFPDVVAPFTTGWSPPSATISGIGYPYVLSSGDYVLSSISLSGNNNNTLLVTGDARLYVSGNVSLSGKAQIEILPGASLELYVAGASTSLGGNGVANNGGNAVDFRYWGLPSNTSISVSGNGQFTGTIYAPNAALTLNGGGNIAEDIIGSTVTDTVRMNGHFNFHYDEALSRLSGGGVFRIASWSEL